MIYVTGDIHGNHSIQKLSSKKFKSSLFSRDDIIIICGDFGLIWSAKESKEEKYWLDWLNDKGGTVCFVDGNHENFCRLREYPVSKWSGGYVRHIREKVLHLMRGQIFEIGGNKFFTMGGASSHDIKGGILEPDDPELKQKMKKLDKMGVSYRINHLEWWEEELPSEEELEEGLENLKKAKWKVDYIISHCAPLSVQLQLVGEARGRDRLVEYFEEIQEKCSFKKWYFGHYHMDRSIKEKYVALYNQIVTVESNHDI